MSKLHASKSEYISDEDIEAIDAIFFQHEQWTRQQMLVAEGIDPNAYTRDKKDHFNSLLPVATFGSDIWLKRQILPVLCHAYEDTERIRVEQEKHPPFVDQDEYVYLIIPPRHKKFHRLVNELGEKLPWIHGLLTSRELSRANAIIERLDELGLGASVRVHYRE